LLVFDGIDGSGKATQIDELVERLENDCHTNIRTTDFPRYDKWSSVLVKAYLTKKFGKNVNPYISSIFYAIDRFAASFQMHSWLGQGELIISNRYVTASKGHLAGKIKDKKKRIKFLRWLDWLEYGLFDIPKEDINILLNVSAERSQHLVDQKGERDYVRGKARDLHEEDLNHLIYAATSYKQVAADEGWITIDCMKKGELLAPKRIHELVYEAIMNYISS